MAIKERKLEASNQWEIKATGEDIPKLKGMLNEVGNEAYRKAFHENEGNFERITDPSGNPTHVHKRDVEEALTQGYGKACLTPTFVVPELPWQKNHVVLAGKHKYKFDKETRSMVEVS